MKTSPPCVFVCKMWTCVISTHTQQKSWRLWGACWFMNTPGWTCTIQLTAVLWTSVGVNNVSWWNGFQLISPSAKSPDSARCCRKTRKLFSCYDIHVTTRVGNSSSLVPVTELSGCGRTAGHSNLSLYGCLCPCTELRSGGRRTGVSGVISTHL